MHTCSQAVGCLLAISSLKGMSKKSGMSLKKGSYCSTAAAAAAAAVQVAQLSRKADPLDLPSFGVVARNTWEWTGLSGKCQDLYSPTTIVSITSNRSTGGPGAAAGGVAAAMAALRRLARRKGSLADTAGQGNLDRLLAAAATHTARTAIPDMWCG